MVARPYFDSSIDIVRPVGAAAAAACIPSPPDATNLFRRRQGVGATYTLDEASQSRICQTRAVMVVSCHSGRRSGGHGGCVSLVATAPCTPVAAAGGWCCTSGGHVWVETRRGKGSAGEEGSVGHAAGTPPRGCCGVASDRPCPRQACRRPGTPPSPCPAPSFLLGYHSRPPPHPLLPIGTGAPPVTPPRISARGGGGRQCSHAPAAACPP